jgi:hypothetical protein
MKLRPIVLILRLANTRFENRIAGAAELADATRNTLNAEMAFVVQTGETITENTQAIGIDQRMTEVFSVIVALKNDTTQKDKTGVIAYDTLFDVRSQLFDALLGLELSDEENLCVLSPVSYAGGSVVDINRAWLWYQFNFSVDVRLEAQAQNKYLEEIAANYPNLDEIFAQYELMPSDNIPLTGPEGLPVNIFAPDMEQLVTRDS